MSESVTLKEFYNKVRNIEGFYSTLGFNGYYLPNEKSKCISGEYLWKVMNGHVFALKRSEMKEGFATKRLVKEELLELLEKVLQENGKLPTGLKNNQLPNKEWLINCIFTIDPNNSLFKVTSSQNDLQRNVLGQANGGIQQEQPNQQPPQNRERVQENAQVPPANN